MSSLRERRTARAMRRIQKYEDFYGIDKMSDKEFLDSYKSIHTKAVTRTSIGGALFVVAIILLIVFWDKIFWGG